MFRLYHFFHNLYLNIGNDSVERAATKMLAPMSRSERLALRDALRAFANVVEASI